MRVVRSPDSEGVALGCAAVLLHSTCATIVCLLPSIMTVVLGAAGVEEVGADWPLLSEQADRLAASTTAPSPAAARASRRRAARRRCRRSGLVMSRGL